MEKSGIPQSYFCMNPVPSTYCGTVCLCL